MAATARAISAAALCLALACGKSDSAQDAAPVAAPVPAPIDGRIDPAPYRTEIEATEALLYGGGQGDDRWKNLSKALLELHNAIVFRDTSPLARETSRKLFFFSAQVDAAQTGSHLDEQLADMRGAWERIRADQFASACTTSTTSSKVTMPFMWPSASTTGIAIRSFSVRSLETISWSWSSRTLTNSLRITSRTRFSGWAANRSRNETTPTSFCASSITYR